MAWLFVLSVVSASHLVTANLAPNPPSIGTTKDEPKTKHAVSPVLDEDKPKMKHVFEGTYDEAVSKEPPMFSDVYSYEVGTESGIILCLIFAAAFGVMVVAIPLGCLLAYCQKRKKLTKNQVKEIELLHRIHVQCKNRSKDDGQARNARMENGFIVRESPEEFQSAISML